MESIWTNLNGYCNSEANCREKTLEKFIFTFLLELSEQFCASECDRSLLFPSSEQIAKTCCQMSTRKDYQNHRGWYLNLSPALVALLFSFDQKFSSQLIHVRRIITIGTYKQTRTRMHTHTHARMHTHARTHAHICTHTRTHACTHACTHAPNFVFQHVIQINLAAWLSASNSCHYIFFSCHYNCFCFRQFQVSGVFHVNPNHLNLQKCI